MRLKGRLDPALDIIQCSFSLGFLVGYITPGLGVGVDYVPQNWHQNRIPGTTDMH